MEDRKIAIDVPEATAAAYEKASPERRRRAERAMTFALLSGSEAAAAFDEITARMSDYARKQGLTPEKLDEMLREDADAE